MDSSISTEIEQFRRLKAADLPARHREVFKEESRSFEPAVSDLTHRLGLAGQAEGDLSERVRRQAQEIADDADLRLRAPQDSLTAGASLRNCPVDRQGRGETGSPTLVCGGEVDYIYTISEPIFGSYAAVQRQIRAPLPAR